MSFAIIETGGKQYKVSASNILKVEKLNIVKGKKVEFKKVLLVNDDKNTEVGNPTVEGALVEGLVLDNIKDNKENATVRKQLYFIVYDSLTKERFDINLLLQVCSWCSSSSSISTVGDL